LIAAIIRQVKATSIKNLLSSGLHDIHEKYLSRVLIFALRVALIQDKKL
jgi:hypothetical protein